MSTHVKRAYRYRFYPTDAQAAELSRTFGCVRKVYNMALAARTEALARQERVNYHRTSAMLTAWKKTEELAYLNDVSSVPLQQCLRHLQVAVGHGIAPLHPADFIVEDQVRKPMGGLLPGERVTHTITAIVYGAILSRLVPVILHWRYLPSRLAIDPEPVPMWLRLGLSALAVGTLASATRNAYAVIGFLRPLARWPWAAPATGSGANRPPRNGAAE